MHPPTWDFRTPRSVRQKQDKEIMLEMFRAGCRSVRRELWDYAEERLAEGPMERVEQHLERCTACRQEVETLRQAQRLLATCRESTPPSRANWADLRSRLAAEGLADTRQTAASDWQREPRFARLIERRPEPSRAVWMPRLAMASGVATLLIFAAIGYRMTRPVPAPISGAGTLASVPGMSSEALKNLTKSLMTPISTGSGYGLQPEDNPNNIPQPETVATVGGHADKGTAPDNKVVVKAVPPPTNSENVVKNTLKKKTPPKPDTEYNLRPDGNGKLKYLPKNSDAPQMAKRDQNKSVMPSDEGSRYAQYDNGYYMGTLTPVSHEDEVY